MPELSSLPRWRACLCLLASLLAVPAAPATAQTMAATLFVEVRDQSGAWLPDVTITLTDQQTALMREGTTSSSGLLVIPLLTAGTYTLQASRDGFKTEIVRDIAVQAGVRGTVAVVLVPGEVTEQVVVSADLTTLRAGSGAVGEVFEGETLVTVPVSERDVIQFTFQAPGVAPPSPGSRLSTQGNTGLNNSGSREAANNFLLDGVDNNDLFLNRLVVNPSLDAVKEVSMLQSTYDAEHGRSAGAQVNVVIKSGTRTLRGSAYEYFRDEAFDARPAFLPEGTDKPSLGKHQFGGTIGGPIGRFPSFYFVNVEAIQANEADTRLARVPTDAERAGDFSAFGRPIIDPFTQQPFPGNIIPASRMSAAGLNTADLYPRANTLQQRVGQLRRRRPRAGATPSSSRSRPTTTAGRTSRSTCATRSAARIATCRSRRVRATCRPSAPPCSTRATTSPPASTRRSRAASSTNCVSASTRSRATACRPMPAPTPTRRSASPARRCPRSTRATRPSSSVATRRSATTRTCRCSEARAPSTSPTRSRRSSGGITSRPAASSGTTSPMASTISSHAGRSPLPGR